MNHPALALLLLLIFPTARADTWTSTDDRTLEGEFVNYDLDEGNVTLRRADNGHYIEIPEQRLCHADQLRAVALETKSNEPYWYTDYTIAKAENPKRHCLFFYRNDTAPEAFELFCHKLLLRERFQKQLNYRYIVVCIQEELPEELFTSDWPYPRRPGETTPPPKAAPPPGSPYLITIDFYNEIGDHGTFIPSYHELYSTPPRSRAGSDPFAPPASSEHTFLPLEEIDKLIQHFPREKSRE
ncbi:MAG: hypothetical protein Q7Q73_11140 [Verrucomicrobiota bacterium JB024]|nr:hypothetical protein [Verrucomicrobiota bacterium JB024]